MAFQRGRGAASWRLRNAPSSAAFPAFGTRAVLRGGHQKRQIQLLEGAACPPAAALRAAETAAMPAREMLAGSPAVTKAVLAALTADPDTAVRSAAVSHL